MKYLSYILAVVSFALGQTVFLSPWVMGIARNIPNPMIAELNVVDPPPSGPEATAEAYFWEPTLTIPPCRVISRTEWISDDVQQTFRLLHRIGIGLFVLQAIAWCTFVSLPIWMNRNTRHAALLGTIGICLVYGVFTIAELTLMGPTMIDCPTLAPGIFIKSVELVQSTLVVSLGSVATGFAAIVISYWICWRATT